MEETIICFIGIAICVFLEHQGLGGAENVLGNAKLKGQQLELVHDLRVLMSHCNTILVWGL